MRYSECKSIAIQCWSHVLIIGVRTFHSDLCDSSFPGFYVPCRFLRCATGNEWTNEWMAVRVCVCTIYDYFILRSAVVKSNACRYFIFATINKGSAVNFPIQIFIYLFAIRVVRARISGKNHTHAHRDTDTEEKWSSTHSQTLCKQCAIHCKSVSGASTIHIHVHARWWWWEGNEYYSHGNKRADTPIVFETSILRVNTNESIQSPANFTSLCLRCIAIIMLGAYI